MRPENTIRPPLPKHFDPVSRPAHYNQGGDKIEPRLTEVLGVATGVAFYIKIDGMSYGPYKLNEQGNDVFHVPTESSICMAHLIYAINHPESIIRSPRLTEAERAIMRATGARWVSRDSYQNCNVVRLWDVKPKKSEKVVGYEFEPSVGDHAWAAVYKSLFPSVNPGDCIEAEVAGDDG